MSRLLKQIDEVVQKDKSGELASFAVFLTEDAALMEAKLQHLAKNEKLSENLPLTISEIPEGPPHYRINEKAEITVLLYKDNEVVHNFALEKGQLAKKQARAILSALLRLQEK